MKKILFLTGTRADFGKLKALIRAVDKHEEFDAYIFATGMHLLRAYGTTYTEIEKENFHNIFLSFNQAGDTSAHMDIVLADTIRNLGQYVREFCPDMIVVHGDRIEALAGAIVASLNFIRLAHIEGGELSGTVDEHIRHAITKLAQYHFTANDRTKQRLLQLGEDENNIFTIGSPDVDIMLSDDLPSFDNVRQRYGITFDKYAILIYHPVAFEVYNIEKNINELIEAALDSGRNYVIINSNNDFGSDYIRKSYLKIESEKIKIFPSLRFEYFLALLKHADFIIGNSSAGIHEAPVYGVPTINVGTRQKNRSCWRGVINVTENKEEICAAINSIPQRFVPCFGFGRGNSAELFMQTIDNEEFWNRSLQKQFVDL